MVVCRFSNSFRIFVRRGSSAMIAHIMQISNYHCSRETRVMARPVKAIATLASLAVLACSIFAASWVGLALLGY